MAPERCGEVLGLRRSLVTLPMAGPPCFHRGGGDLGRLRRLGAALSGFEEDVIARWAAHYACSLAGEGRPSAAEFEAAAHEEVGGLLARMRAGNLEGLGAFFSERARGAVERGVPLAEACRSLHLLDAAVIETLRAAGRPAGEVLDLQLALAHLGCERTIVLVEAYRAAGGGERRGGSVEAEIARLQRDLAGRDRLCGLVGMSLPMQRVYERLALAARSRDTVLLAGESGTGKELAARAIHALSGDPLDRFVALNCAALPRDLIESELFGHARGAFSGAAGDRPGVFRAAHGGTLLLDEVTELPPDAQAKLLRALQEHAVRPVGTVAEVPVAVRVVASTNRDLRESLEGGRLRRDLFYRLQQLVIVLPPLRERREDIPLLVGHFIARAGAEAAGPPKQAATAAALARLCAHDWPGNVRELENVVRLACRTGRGRWIDEPDLPPEIAAAAAALPPAAPAPAASAAPPPISLRDAERAAIGRALRSTGGNKTRAAELLGISRKQLYVKIKEYGLVAG